LIKILVVDDEEYIRDVIVEYLNNEGYLTSQAEDGLEAKELLENEKFDLMILDVMMPDMDGFTLLEELDNSKKVPTIILSARGEEIDKLTGFDKGIDDYLCKPFSPKELVARVKAILNRVSTKKENYRYKDLFVNFLEHTVMIKDEEIYLTPKEFELLEYFIQNRKIAINREKLLKYIWGYDFFGDDRTVDTHIKMLRNHLGEYRDLVETVRGIGYRFNDEK
jgi:response regulator receiver domain protein